MNCGYCRCGVCGYVAEGQEPPSLCPICGATSNYFVPFKPPAQPDGRSAEAQQSGTDELNLSIESVDDIPVLAISGRLDMSGVESIEERFRSAAPEATRVIVDLGEVDYLSSAAIRLILEKSRDLKSREGNLALCRLQALVAKVFEIARLEQVFPILATREDAVAKLKELVP